MRRRALGFRRFIICDINSRFRLRVFEGEQFKTPVRGHYTLEKGRLKCGFFEFSRGRNPVLDGRTSELGFGARNRLTSVSSWFVLSVFIVGFWILIVAA